MRLPTIDPWTAPSVSANDTDPGSVPATMVDGADASVTREHASAPARCAGSGTDPGIGKPRAVADTLVDNAGDLEAPRTWEEDTSSNTWDGDRTEEGAALEARLRRLGGRAPQFAHFQPDSAGRYAASYDAIAKPVKSRAISRTEPFGVIVAPADSPLAEATQAATEPMIAVVAPMAARPAAVSLADVADVMKQGREVDSRLQTTTTVPGSLAKNRSLSRVLYGSLLLVALAVSALAYVIIGRGPTSTGPSPSLGRSAAVSATATGGTETTAMQLPPTTATTTASASVADTSKPPMALEGGLAPTVASAPSARAAPTTHPRPSGAAPPPVPPSSKSHSTPTAVPTAATVVPTAPTVSTPRTDMKGTYE